MSASEVFVNSPADDHRRLAPSVHVRRALAAAVCVLAVGVSVVCLTIWSTYYANHPLWIEHAANAMVANLRFNDTLAREGYWAALNNAFNSARAIFQPAVLALVSPRLLWSPHSHVLVTAPLLLLFLALLARFVRSRTGSAFLACAAALIFCSFGGLYDERNGLGVPWPDFQSMFFLSSGALSMALYSVERKVSWLAVAGACVSMTALARDTGSVYAAVVLAPMLAFLLVTEIRNGFDVRGMVSRLAACGIPALPAIVLLYQKFAWLNHYYMSPNGTTLRKPMVEAIQSTWELFSAFTGILALAGLSVLLFAGLAWWPRRDWARADVVVLWWPLSFLGFLLVNGYTSDLTKEVMYIAPGIVVAALTLAGGMDIRSRPSQAVVAAVLLMCVGAGASRAFQAYDRASHPGANALRLRHDQRAVAQAVASIPQQVSWQSYSPYDWGTVISALTFYDFGHYQPSDNRWFHNRRNYWDGNFPNMDLHALQAHVFAKANEQIDLAIVLAHPDQKPAGMEDYSFSIASYVAAHVQADPAWRHYRDVETSVSGTLALYLNGRRTNSAILH